MKLRSLATLAAAVGVWSALAPAAAANPNQALAGQIAQRLDAKGLGSVADVKILCEKGTVTLTGVAASDEAKMQVLSEARTTPGVSLVRDGLMVSPAVTTAQGVQAVPVEPTPLGGPFVEPTPLGAPGMHTPDMQAPPLPPYAWPTYAPYNNVSRVAYPQAYPHNAFPFIGPFYPFPKVPLGWRKVVLEWDDGHWFMGRASTPHDYWRVKFW